MLKSAIIIVLGVIILSALILGLKIVYTLATKPNLRYYLIQTLKDAKYMYYRYHV
ncbi:MAG: hypothetical protein PHE84_03135 [bacterium]|nr:hypothetical protein [bacterium]